MATLGKMIRIAATSHEFKLDAGKKPYILHPMRVMMRLRTDDEELMMIAIGHDLLEDDPSWTIERLREEGFSERVLAGLAALTHPKEELYEDYIQRVATNEDATRVKLEDLRDNSDITRLKGLRDKDFERIKKYNKAYIYLSKVKEIKKQTYG